MRRRTAFWLVIVAVLAVDSFLLRGMAKAAQESSAVPRASAVVKPEVYVSLDPVPRGQPFEVAVVVEIARGYHINSHHPSEAYLIPTTLTAQLPAGFELLDTMYPDGRPQKFSFSPDSPLDVYAGRVRLKLRLLVQTSAPVKAVVIPLTLRYQACNDSTCLPPVRLPVVANVTVGAANAKSLAVHPEIFSPAGNSK